MTPGIEMSIAWFDDDVIELRVRATNGRFAGQAFAYVENNALPRLAAELQGFPLDAADSRVLEFGTFDASYAGGGVGLKFCCTDAVGHAEVEVRLRTDPRPQGRSDSAQFAITVEAAAVDEFVDQLKKVRLECGASVVLSGG